MILEKNIKISVIAFPSNPYPTIFHSATDWKFCSHFSHNPLRSHISSVCLSREREIEDICQGIYFTMSKQTRIYQKSSIQIDTPCQVEIQQLLHPITPS